MLAKRIIACLDVKDGKVVKGVNFENLRYSGDPVELGIRYSKEGIDELVFLDITASVEKRKTMVETVEKVAKNIMIPFTIGGGIWELDLAFELIYRGADKVSLNSGAVNNPELITKIAEKFGSQAVVVAIDAKRTGRGFEVFTHSGRKATGILLEDWCRTVEELGAGEILLTSIDKDGVKEGYDIEMLEIVRNIVTIPVIISGGAGKKEHFLEAFKNGADAALAASVFHYSEIEISELKKYLFENGVTVRI
ncbi:MAG: imidazole glycerol-phosphate synthase subunit HisF [Thermotogaceae bacterium]|jgi:cyclase|nr:imidazole glycerol-phosphate synthase subunit HisF [Thermotogaceae bacterium]MDN5336932.1 imidazole glycerol-phosphate synthase subunit HisF [Thermotogaceae bacterium]